MHNHGKLLEQAETILNGNLVLQKSEFPNIVPLDDEDKVISGNAMDRPQERRPGLCRKRAKFYLKPKASQTDSNDNVNLNIDQLEDPEDFFIPFEKLENARKELQKQRGEFSKDSTNSNLSMEARSRRPGILGKTAGYKHRYSSVFSDSDEVLSLQDIPEKDNPSQSSEIQNNKSRDEHRKTEEEETPSQELMDATREDLAPEPGNMNESLLNKLLSTTCTELDGGGAVSFLRDRLQIKQISLDKLCLPDLENPRKRSVKASVEKLHKRRKALSDIDNNIRRAVSRSSKNSYQVNNSSMYQGDSSSSQIVSQTSPFPFRGIEISPDVSTVEGGERQDLSPDITSLAELARKELNASDKSQSSILEGNNTEGSDMVTKKPVMENLISPLCMPMDENPNKFNDDMDNGINAPDCVSEDKVEDMQQETKASEQHEVGLEGLPMENMDCNGSQLGIPSDSIVNELNSFAGHLRQDDGHPQTEDSAPEQNNEVEDIHQEKVVSEQQELVIESLPLGDTGCCGSTLDGSNSIANKQRPGNIKSQATDILPEQNNETYQELSAFSSKEQIKRKASSRNRWREVSPEKSLQDAGTVVECGVRKSTRIKTTPLEYWKGERFLFARIHKNHLTVLGLKYESPANSKKEKPVFRVKSFVSDEYKELVEKVAFH